MTPVLIELQYPTPRGKYCYPRRKCSECSWPADWLGREDSTEILLCIVHVGDWARDRSLEIPVRKVA